MSAPFSRSRRPGLLVPLGIAVGLHALAVAAAFLVPREAVEKFLAGGAAPSASEGGLEQEVILASPPEEAPPAPIPAEASPALADAAPAPSPEPPPPPDPAPDFVQPEPSASVAAAEPVAPAIAVPAPAIPSSQAMADDTPRIVVGNAGFPRPAYPYTARARRQEGTVVLAMDIVNGAVVGASVLDSSGYPLLDQAAVHCVRSRWRFPATITASMTQPIQFSLN